MAKEIKGLEYKVEDTEVVGSPDKVSYSCLIVDSGDNALAKRVKGDVESPDMSKTIQQMYDAIKADVETAEGIS